MKRCIEEMYGVLVRALVPAHTQPEPPCTYGWLSSLPMVLLLPPPSVRSFLTLFLPSSITPPAPSPHPPPPTPCPPRCVSTPAASTPRRAASTSGCVLSTSSPATALPRRSGTVNLSRGVPSQQTGGGSSLLGCVSPSLLIVYLPSSRFKLHSHISLCLRVCFRMHTRACSSSRRFLLKLPQCVSRALLKKHLK